MKFLEVADKTKENTLLIPMNRIICIGTLYGRKDWPYEDTDYVKIKLDDSSVIVTGDNINTIREKIKNSGINII